MALTSGERSALWRKRQRNDTEKHEKYKQKERERYLKRKERGNIKLVHDMSEREKDQSDVHGRLAVKPTEIERKRSRRH
ncbi:hypothetical protein DPMN_112998 [Dreissena polymorpha]|uniref:Uncharacterized protein n=1 Tax=Dreissena polymorpha TaxID=45954 RepID=A0A9D4QQ96_DREPO|nr:hypothetical protein DPMN_112998 [Dreissena polymorpha]